MISNGPSEADFGGSFDSSGTNRLPEDARSPCVGVCAIDPLSGYCEGCLRTIHEIGAWRQLSPEEKLSVLQALEVRAAADPFGTQGINSRQD
jgi:predicted Fe-S protein YdhL (DUF1289 family)